RPVRTCSTPAAACVRTSRAAAMRCRRPTARSLRATCCAMRSRGEALHWPAADAALTNDPIEIAGITSPPLSQLLVHMLKHSDNRYAQMLLQQVGVATARSGVCADRIALPQTSADWGACAMRAFLGRVGIGNGEA